MKVPVCTNPVDYCPRRAMYDMIPSGVKFCNGSISLSYYRNCEFRKEQDIQFRCMGKLACERNLKREDGTCGLETIINSGCWLVGHAVMDYKPLVQVLKSIKAKKAN
ncbi:MAG TPA: hypothetical protein VFF14_01380 [Candidatus Deferrimicrobium sp.]|nr:hypothetical protein [Candidatus Deferrimicrobium sp.]